MGTAFTVFRALRVDGFLAAVFDLLTDFLAAFDD